MPLDRQQIVDRAFAVLRDDGLGGLSMRRLAGELGVAPGALYWHVPNKQELLAAVAEQILAPLEQRDAPEEPGAAAQQLRQALLAVRDGAEVVSFALALSSELPPALRGWDALFPDVDPPGAAAHTLLLFVLGAVAEEQNRDELARAQIRPLSRAETRQAERVFRFGAEAVVAGIGALAR